MPTAARCDYRFRPSFTQVQASYATARQPASSSSGRRGEKSAGGVARDIGDRAGDADGEGGAAGGTVEGGAGNRAQECGQAQGGERCGVAGIRDEDRGTRIGAGDVGTGIGVGCGVWEVASCLGGGQHGAERAGGVRGSQGVDGERRTASAASSSGWSEGTAAVSGGSSDGTCGVGSSTTLRPAPHTAKPEAEGMHEQRAIEGEGGRRPLLSGETASIQPLHHVLVWNV